MNQEHAFALAAEKLLKIDVPIRAKYIRVIFCEIGRILSHISKCYNASFRRWSFNTIALGF